jgi:hypothetical protein
VLAQNHQYAPARLVHAARLQGAIKTAGVQVVNTGDAVKGIVGNPKGATARIRKPAL